MHLISKLVLPCILLAVLSPALAVTATDIRLTAVEDYDLQRTACTAPSEQTTFTVHDRSIALWFDLTGMNSTDYFESTWQYPDGRTFKSGSWTKGRSGHWCYWTWLDVYGDRAFATPGDWRVEVRLNGRVFISRTVPIRLLGNPLKLDWKTAGSGGPCPPGILETASARPVTVPEINTVSNGDTPAESCYFSEFPIASTGVPVYLYLSTTNMAEVFINGTRLTSYTGNPDTDISRETGCINWSKCDDSYWVIGEVQLPPSMLNAGLNRVSIRVFHASGTSYFGAALATVSPPRQLAVNGGFENGLDGWGTANAGEVTGPRLSTEDRTHGRQGVCVGTPRGQSGPAGIGYIYQELTLPADAPFIQLKLSYYGWIQTPQGGEIGQIDLIAGQEKTTLFDFWASDSNWTRINFDVSRFRGQTVTLRIGITRLPSAPGGLCFDDVSAVSGPETVFVVHGISQKGGEGGELQRLLEGLRNPIMGADPAKRFVVDGGFSFECAANDGTLPPCGNDCTLTNGGQKLADYIRKRTTAVGDINIIGYSMGGLLAREMLVEHGDVLRNRIMNVFASLGTPHLGYSYSEVDDRVKCVPLVREMFGDFMNSPDPNPDLHQTWLTFRDGSGMAISEKLAGLYEKWQQPMYDGRPIDWYTVAGTFCNVSTRLMGRGGCPANTLNDGVVCATSAEMAVPAPFSPTGRLEVENAAHTDSTFGTWLMYCATPDWTYPLYAPPQRSIVTGMLGRYLQQWDQY